jgi:UDP-2,3-diacylglucosamine hydrolase
MIHGHTHRPARHREPGGIRWVLPDWDLDHGERRGGYLRIDAEGIRALPLD